MKKLSKLSYTTLVVIATIACTMVFASFLQEDSPEAVSTEMLSQDGFIGEVKLFAGNFAPRGWALCDGQELPISQYNALFSIVGTYYGGDGRTTFRLPDLRGRVPVHPGTGEGLSTVNLGQVLGTEQLNGLAVSGSGSGRNLNAVPRDGFDNRQPSLGMNYIICLEGTYPSRN